MTYLDQDAILAAVNQAEPATDDLEVPELGGTVRVRELTGGLRNRLEAAMVAARQSGDTKQLNEVTVELISRCVIGENGRPIMDLAAAKRIMARLPKAGFRIRDAVMGLSALNEEDREALQADFDDAQDDDSSSG